MDNEMASELARLARSANRIARQTSRTADFTRNILRRAIREIVASFPIYRTYVYFDGGAEADRIVIHDAITKARTHESAIDDSVYAFLESVLTADLVAAPNSGFSRSAVLRFAMTFQQYSGPVMAKGLEDTSFYRFNRFIGLNEVGGDPRLFGRPLAAFHAANAERATRWPHAMLASATHDTKRGEDARARLAALSEMPDAWAGLVTRLGQCLHDQGTRVDPSAMPDRNDEYAFYQTLIATVPPALLGSVTHGSDGWSVYAERVTGAMRKAMREARVHTTWATPNETYEAAMDALIAAALTGERGAAFREAFLPFAAEIAQLGAENSLVQTALKLTMPGVPDIYQGAELWDLSMVDPDNRRPVDFKGREAMLEDLQAALETDRIATMTGCLADWQDGRCKLALTTTLLDLRRSQPELFADGTYEPLHAEGPGADMICAFARRHGGSMLVVVAARFPARRRHQPIGLDTRVNLPDGEASWHDALTGQSFTQQSPLQKLLRTLPVAVLTGVPSPSN